MCQECADSAKDNEMLNFANDTSAEDVYSGDHAIVYSRTQSHNDFNLQGLGHLRRKCYFEHVPTN